MRNGTVRGAPAARGGAARVAPAPADEPPARRDDFTAIRNIGAARARKLANADPPINTFAELADATIPRLQQIFPGLEEGLLRQWKEDARAKAS